MTETLLKNTRSGWQQMLFEAPNHRVLLLVVFSLQWFPKKAESRPRFLVTF